MTELREVFEMVTKQTEPDVDAWNQQEDRQRRRSRNRRIGALALAAAIGIVAAVVVIRAVDEPAQPQPGGRSTAQPTGPLDPGRYVIKTYDPAFNDSHRITIDVPDGFEGFGETGVHATGAGGADTDVFLYDVGYTFADACDWKGTLTPISSADELVAALAGQRGLNPTSPTDVVVSGFSGTTMEITVPPQAELDRCSEGRMQAWAIQSAGHILLGVADQHVLLWILDVDGVPLIIDATLGAGASEEDRAELEQMVESIQIDPREEG